MRCSSAEHGAAGADSSSRLAGRLGPWGGLRRAGVWGLLVWVAIAGRAEDAGQPRAESNLSEKKGLWTLTATLHDLREDEATHQALEQRLHELLLDEGRKLTGLPVTPVQIARSYHWLRRQAGVQQTLNREVDPLTGRVHLRVELTLPRELVPLWTQQLCEQHLEWRRTLLAGGAATGGLWLLTLVGAVILDRLTGGYRRVWLVPGALLTAAGLTAAGWWYLVSAMPAGS